MVKKFLQETPNLSLSVLDAMSTTFDSETIDTIVKVTTVTIGLMTYFYKKNKDQTNNMPELVLTKSQITKNSWKRYTYGCPQIDDAIQIADYNGGNLQSYERDFIEHCRNPEHKNSAYFYSFNNEYLLVLNSSNGDPNIIVNHGHTKLTLENRKFDIRKMFVQYVKIKYTNGKEKTFYGIRECAYTKKILKDTSITIHLDEVLNRLDDGFCNIDKTMFNNLPETFDMLSVDVPDCLKYTKLTIRLILYKFNTKYAFAQDIIVEKVGTHFQQDTKIKKIRYIK